MFNLYEILQNAQNGYGTENLAKQFGLSREQTEAVIQALLPSLSSGFQSSMMNPAAFGSFMGAMSNPQNQAAYATSDATQAGATASQGAELFGQMFGPQAMEPLAKQAAVLSGVSPQIIQKMLPVLFSMLMNGVVNAMREKGFGGFFDQMAQSGAGSWGNILGQMFGGAAPAPQAQPQAEPQAPSGGQRQGEAGAGGVFGNLWGSILGQALGGGQAQQPSPNMQTMPGFDPATIQAGFEALSKMFQPGGTGTATRAASDVPPTDLSSEIGDILSNKK
ncbi:DUF937 domain-containing protein [Beijerinckia mobilis]|uniref:DUF937 domain-containing protein n=1 Tax=Beijerinckia mobilis TaxID=231434 RepID=UPI00068A7982|nr:DUF937 domain-containing protein [Beijerinckia mobilis]